MTEVKIPPAPDTNKPKTSDSGWVRKENGTGWERDTVDQDEQNYELLRSSELGVFLTRAYLGAVNHDPRLAETKLVPIPPGESRVAFASPKWSENNTSGRHEVHVRLNELDEVLELYRRELAIRPATVERAAEMFHIDPGEVTPQLYYVFSLLHELGHSTDHHDNEHDPESYRLRIRRQRQSLPLGYLSTNQIVDPTTDAHRQVMARKDELFAKHNVDTLDDLLRINHTAYRDMSYEKLADEFAVEVLEMNPNLFSQLTQPSVEQYRNYPGFGSAAA